MESNAQRFATGAAAYDEHRPSPPPALVPLALAHAGVKRAALVVDLGCGTGLSTRQWAPAADRVIGVDPSEAMLAVARARSGPGVEYVAGHGASVDAADGAADIVSVVQALHWMAPGPTLGEIARVLRPGGVLVVADCEFPPAVHSAVDAAFERFLIEAATASAACDPPGQRWDKAGHAARVEASGHFSAVRSVPMHAVVHGDARAFVAFAMTTVDWAPLSKLGVAPTSLGVGALQAAADRHIGEGAQWVFGYRVLIATKESRP